jgi:hypothetical protein
MPYNINQWRERIRNRSDLSSYVFHMTKPSGELSSIDVLLKILKERNLIGSNSNGFIGGRNKAVCFQDVPAYGLSQNVFHEQKNRASLGDKIRYKAIGVAFPKKYIYFKGGRPVIYERKEVARGLLPENEWWRIVDFDLGNPDNIVDWTHEREWRVKGDMTFKLSEVTVILTMQSTYKKFVETVDDDLLKRIGGITVLDPVLS